jgi:thimet oligopeptidase
MPLTTESATLLAAYDDVYNLAISTAYTEPLVLKDVHPDEAVRKAAEACMQRASSQSTALLMSLPIYQRLQAIDARGVSPDLAYTVRRQLENYRRAGVDKDEATRKRIVELQDAITATTLEFERNIAEDKRTVTVRPEELKGLPADYLASRPAGPDGTIKIGMAYPDVLPVVRYAESDSLRKRLMTAFSSRAHPVNDAVLARLISQRMELASLLGYKTYAEYDLANRMVRDPVRAQAFIDEIAAAARPVAQADAARMLARLQKDDPSVKSLGTWSSAYASRLIRKEEYDVDPQVVRQYFAYPKVQAGIMQLAQDLFQVEFRPWATPVWHPDVKAFEMVEAGKVIGRFYLDMHPREGKFTHAQMAPVRVGIAGRLVPVAILETNFPKGLMEHGDVVTFLHEFGHLLHWMFAGHRPLAAQNFSEIENDVIEAPSQLLEEWVWDYDTLKSFATNEAGEPIPQALVAKMNAGRRFGEAFGAMSQLGYSAASLDYYSQPAEGRDLTEAYNKAFGRYALAAEPEGTHSQASFGHLSGYGSAYYTYTWSKALASDLLSRFRVAGLRDQATARRYREMILAPGGSASMNVLARNFLGREWSVAAYRAELERGSGASD